MVLQIILAKPLGGIGCAIAISGALFLGQGLIMNLYYQKKQELDIRTFWIEIGKMSVVPMVMCLCSMFVLRNYILDGWLSLGVAVLIFMLIYIPLFYCFSMNQSERDLFVKPLVAIKHKMKR